MTSPVGRILWHDISVPEAGSLRDFYSEVVGWEASETSMGDYADYSMAPPGDAEPVAGVCHARGANAGLPPQWLMYVGVADLDRSLAGCVEHGGEVVDGPRQMGGDRFAVIRDPAGAVLALYQSAGAAD